jgi:hypothetical protein
MRWLRLPEVESKTGLKKSKSIAMFSWENSRGLTRSGLSASGLKTS